MRARTMVAGTMALVLWMGAPGSGAAAGPLLSVADLDAAIARLPASKLADPLTDLVGRLSVLRAAESHTSERTGLCQAIALIRIVRTTRLAPASGVPRLAIALTRSTDQRGNPAGTARRGFRDRPTR